MNETWVLAAFLAFSLLDALVLAYVFRHRTRRVDASGESGREDTVECPECGARNDRGYRFCRRCVSDLPGGRPLVDGSPSRQSRQTL